MDEDEGAAGNAASLRMEIESAYVSVLSELRRIAAAEQQLGALVGTCGDDEEVQVRVARDAFERAVSSLLTRRTKAQAKAHDVAQPTLGDESFEPERFLGQPDEGGVWEVRSRALLACHLVVAKSSSIKLTEACRCTRSLRRGNNLNASSRTMTWRLRRSLRSTKQRTRKACNACLGLACDPCFFGRR